MDIKESSASLAEGFGQRIAALRLLNAQSLEDVASRAGLTKSYLSKLERGVSQPSIATVLKLAKAFGVPSGRLLGDSGAPTDIVVVKKGERIPFSRTAGRAGYVYEAIAAHGADKRMTPFIMRPPLASSERLDLVTHAGEELVFVISGRLELIFKDRRFVLEAGDSVYFAAALPHRSRSLGRTRAEALVVVSAPQSPADAGVPEPEPGPAPLRRRKAPSARTP
ncbi:helix-turn-helix domain-containing protein [Ramlibacter sp.]|uniref:helix-turn-helix domain-containing protein n=1 Tax=Ramlibacter sp. TaxID=1917967 RepID=UPI003D0DC39B